MKFKNGFFCFGVVLGIFIVLSSSARASTDANLIVEEIQKLIPEAAVSRDDDERKLALTVLGSALARLGHFEAALEVNRQQGDVNLKQRNSDEIWRATARRLAWQGNIEAATRCAERIEGQFSRADGWLAVARAAHRAGNSDAVRAALKQAEPAVRATQSPLALAYLAYLYAQNSDATAARQLFAQALALPYSSTQESYNAQRAIVAYFQAKCAWSREAVATAGTQLNNLQQAKPLLIARREWALLYEFADRLPARQGIELLLELSGVQLELGAGEEAKKSLAAARARFTALPLAEQGMAEVFALRLRLALLEIAHGETDAGWKRFAALSASPQFDSKWEFAFYYSLIAPQNQAVLKLSSQQHEEYEQKAIAACLRQAKVVDVIFPFSLLDIADAQIKRGDREAARRTLQLEKAGIRERLAPSGKEARETSLIISLVPYDLITLAQYEREVGMRYQVTLEQARNYWRSRSKERQGIDLYVDALLRRGFFDEAENILNEIGYKNLTPEFDFLSARANDYAADKGIPAAAEWVRKFPNVLTRSMALFRIAASLGRIEPESNELTLRGSDSKNLKVHGWPVSSYRPLFDLAAFTAHE